MFDENMAYRIGLPVIDLLAGLFLDLDVEFHAPLPEGAKIISPNHPSTSDPGLILTLTSEPISILIEDTLFKVPHFGRYLANSGHIEVAAGKGQEAVDRAIDKLARGGVIGVFPEGAISPLEGGFHRPRTGAVRLALEADVPIVPVGIALDRKRLRLVETNVNGEKEVGTWYLRGPYAITVGEPMTFGGDIEDWDYVRESSQSLMNRIAQLSYESALRMKQKYPIDVRHFLRRPLLAD
ncbi:MAG: 1-acyl-sn-glycerol-3-phosphate acyltransferase [Anaerolineae bacterium]|nr:1-acyl-sn-glycerol-3-phosphate acyltransferase [Anaerolineae bacterium]